MEVLVYTHRESARLRYTLEVLFGVLLAGRYRLTTDRAVFANSDLPRINYSRRQITDREIRVPPSGLLEEEGIRSQAVHIFRHDGLPAFFACAEAAAADFPFDLFALMFYQLARYEEYLPYREDRHDRFPASESLAARAGFLELPLVDCWARRLGERLQQYFPAWSCPKPTFRFLPTYDVDLAWAFRYRGWVRQLGGALRQLSRADLEGLRLRLAVLRGRQPDPFQTFSLLDALHHRYELEARFFFLLADPGRYDTNVSARRPALRELIRQLDRRYRIGIHPSYRSHDRPWLLERELQRLEHITGKAIHDSRQHWLRLRLPHTYRRLLAAGIRTDYSMGFADAAGFRAGTAYPFPWYDLLHESTTALTITPFQVMDGTLKNYLHLTPEAALLQLQPIIKRIRSTGGLFCTLWHNSSFSPVAGWGGWQAMYEQLVEQVTGE